MRSVWLAVVLILAAPMAASAAASDVCLRQDRIEGWNVLNDSTLIVSDRLNKKFKVSLTGACHSLQFLTRLAFKPFSGSGLSCLTRNDAVEASLPGYGPSPERCLITDVEEYTAAMEHADQTAEGTLHHHPDTHGDIGAIQ
jgi:hypothetical protein